jgi:D-3-phosphoglycerate dehydrogenase
LLEQADVVSLHVSLNETSRSLLDAAALAHMKPGSFLINASRGEVVDYDALAEALSSGHIAGAAVDVYTSEPGKKGDAFTHPLQNYETVILTPHIGGSTRESQVAIAQETSARLLDFLATGNTVGSVNLPEMPLGLVFSGRFRITNVHENVPGVIAAISECISQAGLNVAGMSLKTRGDVGYVAYDVETGDGAAVAKVCTAIDALSTTWRTTLLNNQGAGPPAPASQPE